LLALPEEMKHLLNYDEKMVWLLRANETVVLTDQRLIIRKSTGFGLKKSFVDYPYSNMVNIKLDGGFRKCSVEILMRSGIQSIRIGNLTKSDAYQLHRIVRENIIQHSESRINQPFPVLVQTQKAPRRDKDTETACMKCGRKISADFAVCPYCSTPLKIQCPEFEKRVDRKFKLCPYCGEDLSYAKEIDLES
jgi:RNA polymerase subunit RPABC4/transcription elongation factor Spt4